MAAIVLGNQQGVRVVVAVTIVGHVWTLLLLVTSPTRCCAASASGFARWVLASHKRLGGFAAGLFLIPLVLIAI